MNMNKTIGAAALLIAAIAAPVNELRAQDVLGGALLGGAAGALLGGAIGGGRGAAIGAIIGSGTGAVIAAEGERRNGYYYHNNGCYAQRPDGSYVVVSPAYCGPAPAPAHAPPPPRRGRRCGRLLHAALPLVRSGVGHLHGVRRHQAGVPVGRRAARSRKSSSAVMQVRSR